jgi:pimeloyl-ACP methyl ester carboxylesterase
MADRSTLPFGAMALIPSSDGVEVAVADLGGEGPPLLLVHGTGFCGGVLRPLAEGLAGSFHCWALDLRGHGSSVTPPEVDYAWAGFADDVLAVVDWLQVGPGVAGPVGPAGPLFGFGHSSGAAALLDAEARRPGTFTALYCYEPILWPSPPPAETRAALIDGARRRRDTFASPGEAYVHFCAKPPLDGLPHEVLRAYIKYGFAPCAGRAAEAEADADAEAEAEAGAGAAGSGGAEKTIRLRCRPETEAAVYRQGLVHDGFSRLGQVSCPVMVASGSASQALEPGTYELQAAAIPLAWTEVLEGLGHLGPLEDPPGVAGAVIEALVP